MQGTCAAATVQHQCLLLSESGPGSHPSPSAAPRSLPKLSLGASPVLRSPHTESGGRSSMWPLDPQPVISARGNEPSLDSLFI